MVNKIAIIGAGISGLTMFTMNNYSGFWLIKRKARVVSIAERLPNKCMKVPF